MLALGLATWAETPEPARSDCHAWSAHPNVDPIAILAGIEPAASGFREVLIEHHLGPPQKVDASMPHPLGDIIASYRREGVSLFAQIILLKGLSGTCAWRGINAASQPGSQELILQPQSPSDNN